MYVPSIVMNEIASKDYFCVWMNFIQIIYESGLLVSCPIQDEHYNLFGSKQGIRYNAHCHYFTFHYFHLMRDTGRGTLRAFP